RVLGIDYSLASKDNTWSGKYFFHKSFSPGITSNDFSAGFRTQYNNRFLNIRLSGVFVADDYKSELGFVRRTDIFKINPQDLLVIGDLLLTGKFNITRTLALTGSQFDKPSYVSVVAGASISAIVDNNINLENTRIISGNVLSGTQVSEDGFLGYYDNQITAIPEGDDYEFFGWNKPVFNKISPSRALTFSWLTPNKKYDLNTNTNGEHRAFVVTGSYENVFPLDMFPLQFLKACMYQDLDEMENLGGYEVAPEDFALTEFICVSKQPHQQIVREGLDLMKEELG
ncbi:hypothetical protein OAP87_06805, partial [Flavobacteriaceae bacterium]|nr:hypothetical protein [Flavobacteriaceae bacterium]